MSSYSDFLSKKAGVDVDKEGFENKCLAAVKDIGDVQKKLKIFVNKRLAKDAIKFDHLAEFASGDIVWDPAGLKNKPTNIDFTLLPASNNGDEKCLLLMVNVDLQHQNDPKYDPP